MAQLGACRLMAAAESAHPQVSHCTALSGHEAACAASERRGTRALHNAFGCSGSVALPSARVCCTPAPQRTDVAAGHVMRRALVRQVRCARLCSAVPGACEARRPPSVQAGDDALGARRSGMLRSVCCRHSSAARRAVHAAERRDKSGVNCHHATSAAACVPPSGAVRLRGSACRLLRERERSRGLGASTLPCARVRHLCRRHFRRGVGGFSAAEPRSMAERGGPASASAGRGDPGGAAVPAEPKAAAAGAPATRTAAAPAASEAAAHFGTGALPQAHRWPRQRCNALRSPRPSLRKI